MAAPNASLEMLVEICRLEDQLAVAKRLEVEVIRAATQELTKLAKLSESNVRLHEYSRSRADEVRALTIENETLTVSLRALSGQLRDVRYASSVEV